MTSMKKNGSGVFVDMESLKALVTTPSLDKAAEKEGSARLLPGVKSRKGSSSRQVIAALAANLGPVNTGMMFGFSAVALAQLQDPSSYLKVDEEQASWIASLSAMTTPIGCLLSGWLMDRFGRKRTIMGTQVPLIAGWLLIAAANSVELIYAGRLLVGLGSGMVGAPSRVYTAEATQPHLRGMLAAVASVGVSVGVLIEYLLGALVSWNMLALISTAVPLLALLVSCFLPESPQWLLSVGRKEQCRCALERLRGSTCDIDRELALLTAFAEKNNIHKPTTKEIFKSLIQPSAYKPFCIITFYFFIYQFSGVNPVTFYAVEVFQHATQDINAYLATIILGVVRVFFTIVGALAMKRCGRRPLTFISSIGCGLTMLTMGTYTHVVSQNRDVHIASIPLASMLVFIAVSTIGYLVVPWVMIGEVYPTQVRGIIGGLTTCCGHFFVFIVVKTYHTLQHLISPQGTYWMYGTVSLTGTLFFYFCLPETKGKTLQEIEDYFSGRTSSLKTSKPKPQQNRPIVLKADKGQVLP